MLGAKSIIANLVSRHPARFPFRTPAMSRRSGGAAVAAAEIQPPCKESRVLIAHSWTGDDSCASTESCLLHLKNPKTGEKACYMMTADIVQEIHWFKEQFSSWFLGNHVLEDGSLYIGTPVDPLFLLLPILDDARMKKGDDAGKFRSLEEILYVEGYPGYQHLSLLLADMLDVICEVRDIGKCKYYRLDDSKVLSWLCCKVKLTMKGLNALENYENMLEEVKEIQAVGLVGDYLKDSRWLDMLCSHLGVDLQPQKLQGSQENELLNPKPNIGKKEEKSSSGKSKAQKKGSTTGIRKVTQFFALQR
ncbi:hypothetical protein KP509_34G056400 [Ceratopteris richardii]|uniref:Ribonuclease H2 subunit B n=1 Tax=Ceratopteris richardii TaxID=49495 RepID=A0A8T2QLP2_CERRI|nr:hypothetical protein KP509_34G056400 [Ceratopteris richardii]